MKAAEDTVSKDTCPACGSKAVRPALSAILTIVAYPILSALMNAKLVRVCTKCKHRWRAA